MLVIGITGTLGAGKGTIVDYLVREKGLSHFSVRGFLLEEIKKRGLPQNRDSMVIVANELRAHNGPSYITDKLYEKAAAAGNHAVIESIRTPGEIVSLRDKSNFILFAVDANPETRYMRIKNRGSETDHIDYQTFIANEKREMDGSDPHQQNLRKCIEMADYVFRNDSAIADLIKETEAVVAGIISEHVNSSGQKKK